MTATILDVARDALTKIPMTEVIRERLSLALDQYAISERRISELQKEVGTLEAKLQMATADRDKAQAELAKLKEEHAEEIRTWETIEFRRGKRTGGVWDAFFPKCHMPAYGDKPYSVVRCSGNCGALFQVKPARLDLLIKSMNRESNERD